MADKNEEAYLDELLNSMSNGNLTGDDLHQGTIENFNTGQDDSEDGLDDEFADEIDKLSLDELLARESGNTDDEALEEPVVQDEPEEDNEPENGDMAQLLDSLKDIVQTTEDAEDDADETVYFDDVEEEPGYTDDEVSSEPEESVNEDESNFYQDKSEDSEEYHTSSGDLEESLADILALDDGMSIDDIPDDVSDNGMTAEEMEKIMAMESDIPSDDAEARNMLLQGDEENKDEEPDNESQPKKKSSRKTKKAKKEKASKKDKPKFSFKNFFVEEYEDEGSDSQVDENQKLINELYGDEEDSEEGKTDAPKGKKSKKTKEAKPKKPKKEKKPKPKKEKKPKPQKDDDGQPKAKFPTGSVVKAVFIAAVVVALIVVFSNMINYKLTVKSAKRYFEAGRYDVSYDCLAGLSIKDRDRDFYQGCRIVASIYQGYLSYNNYITIGDETSALDSLIKAVGRKYKSEADIEKYNVSAEAGSVYNRILEVLEQYGITEQEALNLNSMTDADEYYSILAGYGGRLDDSNN